MGPSSLVAALIVAGLILTILVVINYIVYGLTH